MINTLLNHKIRKDIIRNNKKHNHQDYLRSLHAFPKFRYWTGYHKKKLLFFALIGLLSWHYDLHQSLYNKILSIRSPRHILSHLFLGTEKVEKSINQQKIVNWQFSQQAFDVLTNLYYETDKRLIFGLGRHYLYQVYTGLGLLQKRQDEYTFWVAGGFYKKRNQLVSGVGYNQFMMMFGEAYKTLKKNGSQLTQQEYFKQFLQLFISKCPEIVQWEKNFNKSRHNEYLKSLLADNDRKVEEISRMMHQNLEVSEQEVDTKLEELGMRGMGIRDRWIYWQNREILFSIREYNLHRRINYGVDIRDRQQSQKKLVEIQKQLNKISKLKQGLKDQYRLLYLEEMIS